MSDAIFDAPRTNWGGNYIYSAQRVHFPKTLEEVREIVKNCTRVKALGSRHSFNGIADSTGDQISLKQLGQITLDREARTVTVDGGVTYGQLALYLERHGFALHNLASLPHVSVAGACATATHGSGSNNGNLSTAVSAIEFVTAQGGVVELSRERDGEKFAGAVVSLGALGVVTKLTLDIEPAYQVEQTVYENLSFDNLETHLDQIFASGYSVSLFTDWQNHRVTQAWVKNRVSTGGVAAAKTDFWGAAQAQERVHPLREHPAENCTEQIGIPGPWYDRLPHFRMNFTPSSGAEVQSEYVVPRDKGFAAISAIEKLRDDIMPHLLISELRTVAADTFWMSPCYGRPSMTIHFTWKPESRAVKNVLSLIEEQLAPFDARPHWAKLFTMEPSRLALLYPKLSDFRNLVQHYDHDGKFRNEFLSRNILHA